MSQRQTQDKIFAGDADMDLGVGDDPGWARMSAQVLNERRLHIERRDDSDYRDHHPNQVSGHQKPEDRRKRTHSQASRRSPALLIPWFCCNIINFCIRHFSCCNKIPDRIDMGRKGLFVSQSGGAVPQTWWEVTVSEGSCSC